MANPSIPPDLREKLRRPVTLDVEAVEKPSDEKLDTRRSRIDRSECATFNATMFGRGQVTPENLLSRPLRGFFYSLVRRHEPPLWTSKPSAKSRSS